MNLTRQQLTILGGLLLAGYLVFCGFGYMIGKGTAPTQALPQVPTVSQGTIGATNTPTSAPTPTPRPTPTAGQTVDIVEWTWYESETGNFIYVDGVIKNISDRTMAFVEIFIELQDESKNLLATDSSYIDADKLEPGEESTFKIMTTNRPGTKWVTIKNIEWRWVD